MLNEAKISRPGQSYEAGARDEAEENFRAHPLHCAMSCGKLTGWARKVSLLIVAISLSIIILPTNFRNFWHMYTIGNLQLEDV